MSTTTRYALGLPVLAIVGLALLAAPRVVMHDLHIIEEGTFVNALFVFVPLVVWIAVAALRSSNPFVTLLSTGGVYGLCLVIGHNLFWTASWAGNPPSLGGNLEGQLVPWVEETVLRVAMSVSSLFTGLAVGAVCGVIAWGLSRLRRRPISRPS